MCDIVISQGFLADGGDWVQKFVQEALLRGILTPYDMQVLSHSEYDLKWKKFCDEFFIKNKMCKLIKLELSELYVQEEQI